MDAFDRILNRTPEAAKRTIYKIEAALGEEVIEVIGFKAVTI